MKTTEVRLFKESNLSFIYHVEVHDFGFYHHHPEYELVFIKKGKGVRIIGDDIHEFKSHDLVFLGSNLPHVWSCDKTFRNADGSFDGKGYVIHFSKNSFGSQFFKLPENKDLSIFLSNSSRGFKFYGKTKEDLIEIIVTMEVMTPNQKLYALFNIFEILGKTTEYEFICSPAYQEVNLLDQGKPMGEVIDFLLENFRENIKLKDVLSIAKMSNTQFFLMFKKLYRMSFKTYLLKLRIGYACRLLGNPESNISEIAYESGFENLSNFNRHFKNIKGCTPTKYRQSLTKLIVIK